MSLVYLRNREVNKHARQYSWERVKGAQSRGLVRHQVIEVQAFGLYFENSATTMVRLVRGC